MHSLPEVISDIFTYHGAILEDAGENRMEFLLPEKLAQTLDLPELGKLEFSPSLSDENAIQASYDPDFLNRIGKLFLQNGKISTAVYPSFEPNTNKITKKIKDKLVFANAAFRINKTEKKKINYLLCYFKYIALSDERREGMLSLLINETNFSTSLISRNDRIDIWEKLVEPGITPAILEDKELAFQSACSAAAVVTREKLTDFVKSLERRLNLDIRKGHEYYETLKGETRKAIEKKIRLESSKIDGAPHDIEVEASKVTDKLQAKLEAIDAEQKWKIQDLTAKYSLDIQIEPISMVRIEADSLVFRVDLKRRLLNRAFPLTYNPITRKIDSLPCEFCFYPRGAYYVCDDKLHIICSNCFKKCPRCGKQHCSVCQKNGFSKCKK